MSGIEKPLKIFVHLFQDVSLLIFVSFEVSVYHMPAGQYGLWLLFLFHYSAMSSLTTCAYKHLNFFVSFDVFEA